MQQGICVSRALAKYLGAPARVKAINMRFPLAAAQTIDGHKWTTRRANQIGFEVWEASSSPVSMPRLKRSKGRKEVFINSSSVTASCLPGLGSLLRPIQIYGPQSSAGINHPASFDYGRVGPWALAMGLTH